MKAVSSTFCLSDLTHQSWHHHLFFSLLSLLLIKRFIFLKKIWINKYFSYSLIGFVLFFSYLKRPVGYVLMPTLFFARYFHSCSSSKSFKDFIVSEKYKFIRCVTFFMFWIINSWILQEMQFPGIISWLLFNVLGNRSVNTWLT